MSLCVCAAGGIFRKWSPVPMCSSVFPTFSSIRFSVTDFMLRSLNNFDLSFVHGDRYSLFSFFYMLIYSCASLLVVKYAFFFPFDIFLLFYQRSDVGRCMD